MEDGLKRTRRDALIERSFPPTKSVKSRVVEVGMLSATMDDLTESLLVEILIRLPAKHAHRCKSTCKRWNALISDYSYFGSQFMRHNKHYLLRPLIFSYSRGVFKTLDKNMFRAREFSLSFLPCFRPDDGKEPRVVGSSGGLLLCCAYWSIQIEYYLCNPVTMNWMELPLRQHRHFHLHVHVGFICESSSGEELRRRFTLVRIPEVEGEVDSFLMDIFSSETGEWSEIDVLCPKGFYIGAPCQSAIVYNGVLHFLGPPSSIFAYNPYPNGANDNRFRFINLPADVTNGKNLCLGTSQGHLLLFRKKIGFMVEGEEVPIMVWELKDYDTGSWCLAHQVSMRKMVSDSIIALDTLNFSLFPPRVIAFDGNDSDVLYILSGPSTILVCNLQHMTMKLMSGTPDMEDDRSVMVFPIELPCWPTPIPALP